MAEELRKTLDDLQATVQDRRILEANHLANDLRSTCFTSSSSAEFGLNCSLLFQGHNSLLNFVRKINHLNEFGKCKEKCLALLYEFVSFVGSSAFPYIGNITDTCLSVVQAGKSSASKEKALCLIIKLLGSSWDEAFQKKSIEVDKFRKTCNEELAKRTGTTSTVKSHCFHLLGVLAQCFPGEMMNHSGRMFDVYLRELKKEMLSQRSSDFKVIEGCLKGLSCLLINFTKAIDENPDTCQEIYKYTLMSIQPKTDLTRFAIPVAGLQLLQRHASQFGHLLTDNYNVVYSALQKWNTHSNNQMKHEAYLATVSFFHQVISSINEGLDADQAKKVFIYFVTKFQEMLDTSNASSKILSLAIQGYGLFAGLCRRYMPSGEVSKMFNMMLERCERIYFKESEKSEANQNQLHQLPSFLQSLANIVKEMIGEQCNIVQSQSEMTADFTVSESAEKSLCRLSVLMISNYPQLNKKFSKSCCGSLISLMAAFSPYPDAQKRLVSRIVYQGLIRCCSHQVVLEEDKDDIGNLSLNPDDFQDIMLDSRTVTYHDYLNLWKELVCLKYNNSGAASVNVLNSSKLRNVQELIYNEILSSVMIIFSKLNLAPKFSDDEANKPVIEDASAENVVDFQIFVNLIDLCRDLLPTVTVTRDVKDITGHIFLSRVSELIKELMEHSTKYPFVSGFYKIFSTVMNMCESLEYFKPPFHMLLNSKEPQSEPMVMDEQNEVFNEKVQIVVLLKKFVSEIISHLLQWKNDLLASCVLFILSLPSEIVVEMLDDITVPLQIAFRYGLGYTQLAETGLSAMEKWNNQISSDKLITTFAAVLPDIEPFLHEVNEHRSSSVSLDSQKIDVSALKKVQIRAIRFIGSISGRTHAGLQTVCMKTGMNDMVVWDPSATIPYAVPFKELKLDIHLEVLFPRVVELASQSAIRKTKVAACEVLHSMTIYAIGRSAQQDETIQKQYPLTGIYEHIFPVILKLACDVEHVSRQLFEPLVMQLVHWFTNNRKYESRDTAVLLNSIINGLTDENDGTLREFCARAVKEFLVWSIKQNNKSNNARKNAKSLFKRLYALARHPSAGKRLGSAMAFNHIYRVFREQENFVDEFTFELMVTYIDSLAMAHYDNEAVETKTACSEALNHIQRIIVEKKDLFNKNSNIRRVPSVFSGNASITISRVVNWLLNQCSRSETECRHQCMQLFYVFVPLIPGSLSAVQWMEQFSRKREKDELITHFESRFRKDFHPQMLNFMIGNPLKTTLNWFDIVLASLDCYTWIFQQKMLSPVTLFTGSTSRIFECIHYILHDVAKHGIDSYFKESFFTPHEHESFNKRKCTAIVRIIQFTSILLKQYPKDCVKIFPENFWAKDTFFGIVADCLINPNTMGFNIEADMEISEQLPVLMKEIIQLMSKHLSEKLKNEFVSGLQEEILNGGILTEQIQPISTVSKEGTKLNLVRAYIILQNSGILPKVLAKVSPQSTSNLGNELVKLVFNSIISKDNDSSQTAMELLTLDQSTINLGKQLLDLSFNIGVSADFFVQLLMDETTLVSDTGVELLMKHGQAFFSIYKNGIIEEMCSKSSLYVSLLCQHFVRDKLTCANMISEMMESLLSDSNLCKKYSVEVCNNVLKEWDGKLSGLWKSSNSPSESSNALDIFIKIVALNSNVCIDPHHSAYAVGFDMFCFFLKSKTIPLSFKSKVLTLLNFFVKCENDSQQNALRNVIEEFCSLHFPSRSCEFQNGTYEYENYTKALNRFFFCFEWTGSVVVLNTLINIFCREEHHVMKDEFESCLEKCFLNIDERSHKSLLDVPFKLFSNSDSLRPMVFKCRSVNNVLIPMLSRCSQNAANEFFTDHIGIIMQYLTEDDQRYLKDKWKDQLEMKSCCYKLMELLFSMLPADVFKSDSSPLLQAFASSSVGAGSTKLLKMFMGRLVRDKNEDMTGETELLEERRRFHCCVYNAVIAAVVRTQTDMKWYDTFLFSDNPRKKEFLFDNIIDKNKSYVFPIESDNPLEKRKKFVAFRRSHKDAAKAESSSYQSVNYISSLAESSLSEDVNKFDNNLANVHKDRTNNTQNFMTNEGFSEEDIVKLERDEMNDHECMPNIISLLMYMQSNSIGFPKNEEETQAGVSSNQVPKWLNVLIGKLTSSPHDNVKLFITKLIINCETIFKPYSSHLIAPMMKAVLFYSKRHFESSDSNHSIDQFIVDSVATMLSWSHIAIPEDNNEEKILTRALTEMMMKNIRHENRRVFRHNLEVLKAILECWKKRICDLNTDIIFHQCVNTDIKSNDNFSGLQILGALLSNGLPPYNHSIEVDRHVYFRRIFSNVLSARKEIIDTTSSVIGMSLKYLAEHQEETKDEVLNIATEFLEKLANSSKSGISGLGMFITVLYQITQYHPPFAHPFLSRVLFNMPKLPGTELKSKCINIICLCVDKISNILAELKAKDFIKMLIHRDETLQHSCLKLCSALVHKSITWTSSSEMVNVDDVIYHQKLVDFFFPSVEQYFPFHPSSSCRQEMYDLAMQIYDGQQKLSSQHQSMEAVKTAKLILLRGLNDSEEFFRTQVINFWSEESFGSHQARLAADPSGKVLGLLGDLYKSEVDESGFLTSSCNLLLQAASRSPDFERPIFEHPLSECVFQDLDVDHTWQHRHSSMNPMFVETIAPSLGNLPESSGRLLKQPNMLQATQAEPQFSATVDISGKSTFNWMTGNRVDAVSNITISALTSSTSQSQFGSTSRRQNRHQHHPVGENFGKLNLKRQIEEGDSGQIDVTHLRRRLQGDASNDHYRFARMAQQRKRDKQKMLKREKTKREHSVQLYRTYRVGELPDIEIHHKYLIAPLAALAQHDSLLSRSLLTSLVLAIIKEETKKSTEYLKKITKIFGQILSSSQQCHPAFIGSILDIIHKNASHIKIHPSVIAHAAVKSNQLVLGIRVIEEWLLVGQELQEPLEKRRRMLQSSTHINEVDVISWIELARLYRKDVEVLRGIFTGTPVARPLFTEAIRYETIQDYAEASKVYQRALLQNLDQDESADVASDVEKDLWEDRLLNCLQKLGKWEEVNNFCDNQCDRSLTNTWTNKNFSQRFLSTSLQGKIILLLKGLPSSGEEVLNFVEDAIKCGGEKKELIDYKHPHHVAMLFIWQKDYDQANYYLQKALGAFAKDWTVSATQTDALSRVIHLSDMADFIEIMQKYQGKPFSESDVNALVKKWNRCLPHPIHDSIHVWEDVVAHRTYFIDEMLHKHSTITVASNTDDIVLSSTSFKESLLRKKLFFLLEAVNVACSQNYFAIARKYLNEDIENVMTSLQSLGSKHAFSDIMQQSQSTSMYYLKFAKHLANITNEKTKASKAILRATKVLIEQIKRPDIDPQDNAKFCALLGHGCCLALDVVSYSEENDTVFRNVLQLLQDGDNSGTGILTVDLENNAQKYLKRAVDICSGNERQFDTESETYLAFAKFCNKVLEEKDDNRETSGVLFENHAENMVKYTLRSMKCSDSKSGQEACLRFPRLLQLISKFSYTIKSCFLHETSLVPTWMFLRWTSQLVALLDKEESEAVRDIITRLAKEYPQAVIYPVKTSASDYVFERSESGKSNKSFVKKLQNDLDISAPLVEPFIKSLTMLINPAHIFKEWYEEILQIIRSKDKGKQKSIITKYQNMYNEIFACGQSVKVEEDDDLYGTTSKYPVAGLYRVNFAKKFIDKVGKAFGGSTGGQGLMDEKKFTSEAKNMLDEMNSYCKKQRPETLKEYSKWLADFHSLNMGGRELEIPGQYKGTCKPRVEHHVNISGFGDHVKVMTSIQQPKRISIKASDSHEYLYLVKGNEDLRQDQRIQLIFMAVNSILLQDSHCSNQKLHIDTYQVVPVNSRLGLIEWVQNTETLQEVIYEEAKCRNKLSLMDRPTQLYSDWLSKFAKGNDVRKMYGEMVKRGNYTDACDKYKEIIHQIPQGLLRSAYLRLSSTPESFLALRSKFTKWYGALCITHWVLGIGDRHTSNCMISKKTGAPVGIDFGHAFGTATEGLPIPELIPFRLSPQLCYMVAPHPAKHGELRQSMVYCMTALRAEKETILTMLDIFLKEPSVDWMKYANRVIRVHGSGVMNMDCSGSGGKQSTHESSSAISTSSTSCSAGDARQWYPLRKISIVRKKLSGSKPSKITQDELDHNYQVPKQYLPFYKAITDGLPQKNLRTALDDENLSVDDQVDCLIDQATDPNLLVRTYIGWKFWL